jgi:hypothetical protein
MRTDSWARETASRHLVLAHPRRWWHVCGVARRAGEVGRLLFDGTDAEMLLDAAWLHDIGYAQELNGTGFHPLDGATYLQQIGVGRRICGLVAHHSGAAGVAECLGLSGPLSEFVDEPTSVRDALWYCDMTIGPSGEDLTFEERIAEIRTRRGPDDPAVRGLAINHADRQDAVDRIQVLLARQSRRSA